MFNPSFFVIGAYRSGTTTLYRMLRQHPGVFLPLEKEPNWLAVEDNPEASHILRERSVADRVAYEALYADRRADQVPGDISPEYLRNPHVAGHLASVAPGARLVAVLRNPVDRAWSDFLLHRRDGNETCETLVEALGQQSARTTNGDHRAGHYLDSGLYATQLRRYLDHFPADQLQVHLFEDLKTDLDGTMRSIFAHIGVDPDVEVEGEQPINASGIPRNPVVATALKARSHLRPYVSRSVLERARPLWDRVLSTQLDRPSLSPADRRVLLDHYADEIPELARLLDRDLSHWMEEPDS
ncbi:MAG: sulfotransferase [Actinomycetota bacterium]